MFRVKGLRMCPCGGVATQFHSDRKGRVSQGLQGVGSGRRQDQLQTSHLHCEDAIFDKRLWLKFLEIRGVGD